MSPFLVTQEVAGLEFTPSAVPVPLAPRCSMLRDVTASGL